jgi:hypothetical protein
MTTLFLNQIFYPHNKFDSIHCFEQYMLNDDFMRRRLVAPSCDTLDSITIPSEGTLHSARPPPAFRFGTENTGHDCIFSPRKTDTLFWCAYVLHHGESEYIMIGNKYKTTEIQEKQVILDYVNKNRELMKATLKEHGYKWTNVQFQETQSELMLDKKTSWSAFHAMCMFYKINAILVQENVYMEFKTSNVEPFYQFNRTQDGFISVNTTPISDVQLATIMNTKVTIDYGQDKILKGISNYKIPELEEMATRLGVVPVSPKPKKADWYEAILAKMNQTKLMFE